MKFEVAYRTADGKMAETTIEVADRNAVYSELRRQGITPISLHEAGAKKRDTSDGGKLSGVFAKYYKEENPIFGDLPDPTRAGYAFVGWSTDGTGTSGVFTSTAGAMKPIFPPIHTAIQSVPSTSAPRRVNCGGR